MLLNEVLDVYLAGVQGRQNNKVTGKGLEILKQKVRTLKAQLGHHTMRDLSFERVDNPDGIINTWLAQRRAGTCTWRDEKGKLRGTSPCGDGGLRRDISVINAAVNYCIMLPRGDNQKLSADDNPHFKRFMPTKPNRRERWLSREEGRRLLRAARNPSPKARLTRSYRAILLMLLCGGPRKEAVEKLTWDRIVLAPGANDGRGGGFIDYREPGREEKNKRRAIVAISLELYPILVRAKAEKISEWFLDNPGSLRKTIMTAYKAAYIEGATIHTLRHTYATWAAQDNVPMAQIAEAMGDSVETVERVYWKHSPEYQRQLAQRNVFGEDVLADEQQVLHKPMRRRF